MKHQFTDAQLIGASNKAALQGSCGDGTADYLRDILDALPDPVADEWEPCEFSDIRKGDRVKAVSPDGVFQFRSPIKELSPVGDWLEIQHKSGIKTSLRISNSDFYRIPAPVVHPDPAEHPVIIVDTNYGGLQGRHPFVWDGEIYAAVSGPIRHVNPETITDWQPARIVPAGDDQ